MSRSSIKQKLTKENGRRCFFCGRASDDLVHIFRTGTEPLKAEEIAYCILGCRYHHTLFDNGTLDQIASLPNINWVLEIMEAGDPQYYYRFTEFKKAKEL